MKTPARIEMEGPENLIAQIVGLQDALTRRNESIASLTEKLAQARAGELSKREREKAYREGWQACALRLESTTREAAISLGAIRKNALDVYYEGENLHRKDPE